MARTAHHTPHHHTPYGRAPRAELDELPRDQWLPRLPERRVDFAGLRYSNAELARAEMEGRRPRPQRVRRRFEVYSYCCARRGRQRMAATGTEIRSPRRGVTGKIAP